MIRADSLKLSIDNFRLNASLEVGEHEYFVLLGMTGSGKTLFLESICGLRKTDGGCIQINNQDVSNLEPKDRQIGYVPQDGALFEHLTVEGNIGFSLKVRGYATKEINNSVHAISEKIGISHLLGRKIKGLSGGEKQRVALSRALVSKPTVLILDEPVSALDEYTREAVCRELKQIQRDYGISVIHVCHSFEEAKLVSDRIGIMHEGSIIQSGTAHELMHSPISETVAKILRLGNIFTAISKGNGELFVNGTLLKSFYLQSGDVHFLVHPWAISFSAQKETTGNRVNTVSGPLIEIVSDGYVSKIIVGGPLPLSGYITNEQLEKSGLTLGDTVYSSFHETAICIFK